MPTIGIIICEVLELEFAFLLAKDKSIKYISVISNKTSKRFIKKLEDNGVNEVHEIPHLNSFYNEPSENISVVACVLPMNLHKSRTLLRETLYNVSRQFSRFIDCLFIGYGICGTGEIYSDLKNDFRKPVFILNSITYKVDDCIGLLLGGRNNYYSEQCKCPGTFYMTAGWTYHWNKMLNNIDNTSEYNAIKKMFDKYKRVLLIESPVMDLKEMKNNIADFIDFLNLPVENQQGSLKQLEKLWNIVKESVN